MKATTKRDQTKRFEGDVDVCCHRVYFWYDIGYRKLTEDLKRCLTKEAEERAKTCIIDGCCSGELNCLYTFTHAKDCEIRGWWQIERE